MDRADIITLVKTQLDELSTVDTDEPDTELIDSVLDQCTYDVIMVAPKHLLTHTVLGSEKDYVDNGDGTAYVDRPPDFARIVFISSTEWEKDITDLELDTKRFWNKYTKPGVAKPAAINYTDDDGDKVFCVSPSTASGPTIYYIPKELPKDLPNAAVPGLTYRAAAEVFSILQDYEAAKIANEKLAEWIQINMT